MITPADRRPIRLLNYDYKIVARILAQSLCPVMETHLQSTQHCGVPGNTTLDAVATVRVTSAHIKNKKISMCVLTLDFKHASIKFLSHLFTILGSNDLSDQFINLIRNLYNDATSSVQINCHLQGPIPIRCGVRQGFPPSMDLYALCRQPFLNMLEQRPAGERIGRRDLPVSVVA